MASNDVTLSLPFWLSGKEVMKLARSAERWFSMVLDWAIWPVQQMDPLTCTPSVLDLLAWQRDIDRFPDESLALFRKRIAYAYANARDAGRTEGFERIFERLGLTLLGTEERMADRDWDVVRLHLGESEEAENQSLLAVLIRQYGRTCRRYEWEYSYPLTQTRCVREFEHDAITICASVPPLALRRIADTFGHDTQTQNAAVPALSVGPAAQHFDNDQAVISA